MFKTRWDWNYTTAEQKQLHDRRAYWPRMKALGGCSSMNAMIYIRGNRHDYDGWRDAYGAAGWGYDDVLPYFMQAEGNTRLGAPFHGQDGPLHVEDRRFTHELTHAWVESSVSRRAQAHRRLQRRGAGGRRALPGDLQARPPLVGGRRATCARRWTGRTSTCARTRSPPGSLLEHGRAVGRDLPAGRARPSRSGPTARCWSAAARSTARTC